MPWSDLRQVLEEDNFYLTPPPGFFLGVLFRRSLPQAVPDSLLSRVFLLKLTAG